MAGDPLDTFNPTLNFKEQLNLQRLDQIDRVGTGEGLGAAFDLAQLDTVVMSWARLDSLSDLNNRGQKIEANDLNQRFPGLQKPFTRPMTLGAAFEIERRQQQRAKLAKTIQAGPSNGFYKAASFGAALTAHMMDPIEFGAGVFVDGAFALGAAGKATAQLFRQPIKELTLAGRLGRGAISGAVGNIAVEPIIYSAAKQDLTDYTIHDSFISVVGGAIGFPLLKEAARFAVGRVGRFFARLSPEQQEISVRAAVAHLKGDKQVNIDPIINDSVKETDGKFNVQLPGPPERKYQFNAITKDLEVEDRPFYGASTKSTKKIDDAEFAQIDEDFGDGQYLTDNPNVASGKAASKYKKSVGGVFATRIQKAKFLDLEVPLNRRDRDAFEKILGDHSLIKQSLTGREMFDAAKILIQQGLIKGDKIQELNNFWKAIGFDGYRYTTDSDLGIGKDPHNGVMLFSKGKIAASEPFKPDARAVPKPTRAEIQQSIDERTSQRSDIDFDKEGLGEVTVLKDTEFEPARNDQLEQDLELITTEVQSLKDQGLLTPDLETQFGELKGVAKRADTIDRAIKAATVCLGK